MLKKARTPAHSMPRNRAEYVLIGSRRISEHYLEQRPLIEKIMRDSRGWIEIIVMLINGTRIAFSGGNGIKPERIADASSSLIEATLAIMELFGSRRFNELELQVQENRYLILRKYKDCYIAALTKPNPNLGLIKLAFKKNFTPNHSPKIMQMIIEKPLIR